MLKTEMRNEKTTHLDQMTPIEICQVMNEENMNSVLAVEKITEKGGTPPVFKSSNAPGGKEHNLRLLEKKELKEAFFLP